MEYNIIEFKEKINNYFMGTLSKMEFGKWASMAYYDLLKGGYVECNKIDLYPFLKNLSKIHWEENDIKDIYPCPEESVKEIQDIVNGKKDFDFHVEVSLPVYVYEMFKERPYFDKERRTVFFEIRNAITPEISGIV